MSGQQDAAIGHAVLPRADQLLAIQHEYCFCCTVARDQRRHGAAALFSDFYQRGADRIDQEEVGQLAVGAAEQWVEGEMFVLLGTAESDVEHGSPRWIDWLHPR